MTSLAPRRRAVEKPRQRYLSYLLRLWQTSDGEELLWRASLEVPGTGERHGFGGLENLFEFLRSQAELEERETVP